jgi:hypothetical protein
MGNDRQEHSGSPGDGGAWRAIRARSGWTAHTRSGRVLLITVAVCLCGIVAGVLVAAFSSPAGSPAASQAGRGDGAAANGAAANIAVGGSSPSAAAATPEAPAAAGQSTTGPQVTADGIAKSALRWPSALNQQMVAWKAGSGGAASSAVTLQLASATQASGLKLYVQAKLACRSLQTSVKAAQDAPAVPDAAMQQEYAKALAGLSSAAVDCQNAISAHPVGEETVDTNVNQALMKQALAGLDTGSKELYTATAQTRALHS